MVENRDTINQRARKHFADLGLTYKDIGSKEFFGLVKLLDEILPKNEFTYFEMKVSKFPKGNAPKIELDNDGSIKSAFIRCDGPYFKGREAISFNRDGFIGFAGWADTNNTRPFTETFIKWCDNIAKIKETMQ